MKAKQIETIEQVREFLAFVEDTLSRGGLGKGAVVLGWNGGNPTVRSVAKQLNAKLGKLMEDEQIGAEPQ